MNVLLLTIFIGVVLVAFFIVLFLRETAGRDGTNARDALLPLAVEKPTHLRQNSRSPRITDSHE